jgi:hypothetical protein
MRNFLTAASAAVTAVILGLLIANVASAARAAEIEHAKADQIAQMEAAVSDNDLQAQLTAYRERYEQAYNQLAAAYQAMTVREGQYRALLQRSSGSSADLAAANASLDTRLLQAYAALDAAQLAFQRLGSAPAAAPARAITGPAPTARTAAPATAATTARPATAQPAATPRPTKTPGDD